MGAHRNLVYVEGTGQPPVKATFEVRQLMKAQQADILCRCWVDCEFPHVVPVTWMREWGPREDRGPPQSHHTCKWGPQGWSRDLTQLDELTRWRKEEKQDARQREKASGMGRRSQGFQTGEACGRLDRSSRIRTRREP